MSGTDLGRLGDWRDLPFFDTVLPTLAARIAADTRDILPPRHQVFAALEQCPPKSTRVVILGQDPYPTPGHAHGLAFSAAADTRPILVLRPRPLTCTTGPRRACFC
jgi:uracil-DNA glycosylase